MYALSYNLESQSENRPNKPLINRNPTYFSLKVKRVHNLLLPMNTMQCDAFWEQFIVLEESIYL